jgi:hypothetical protein
MTPSETAKAEKDAEKDFDEDECEEDAEEEEEEDAEMDAETEDYHLRKMACSRIAERYNDVEDDEDEYCDMPPLVCPTNSSSPFISQSHPEFQRSCSKACSFPATPIRRSPRLSTCPGAPERTKNEVIDMTNDKCCSPPRVLRRKIDYTENGPRVHTFYTE